MSKYLELPDMYGRVEMVTPEKAEKWLSNMIHNRNISRDAIVKYTNDIKNGMWQISGQGIIFNEDGQLVDGQHRLAAIVKTGVSVPLFVIYGEPKSTSIHDMCRKRTVSNSLKMAGLPDILCRSDMPGTVTALYSYRGQKGGNAHNNAYLSVPVIESFIKDNAELLIKSLEIVVFDNGKTPCTRKAGCMAACFSALFAGCDAKKLRDFFHTTATGISTNIDFIPALILRKSLTGESKNYLKCMNGQDRMNYITSVTLQAIYDYFNHNTDRRRSYALNMSKKPYYSVVEKFLLPKYCTDMEVEE